MTALPGRILRAGLTFLQDGTGGIAVQLPDGFDASRLRLGTIVRVTGTLADPYANLELRAGRASDVVVMGEGGIPAAAPVSAVGLVESREGTLARASGVISRLESGTSGSLAVTLRDETGEMRVFVFGTLGLSRDAFPVGAALRVTGIVGQRESSSGAADGHRLWPRDRSDVAVTVSAPTAPPGAPTPRPGSTPRPTERPKPTGSPEPSLVRISSVRDGDRVAIQGTVTSRAGLFDSDDRRLTLQDASGAILVRLPEGASPPSVGSRLRVEGVAGTWFSARQLQAAAPPRVTGRGSTLPIVLRRAPAERDEWRLVRVTVRITKVSRDGDAWRAEASLGAAGTLPIVGLARSGIAPDALVEGRDAVVTGIVKRAHPSATDQRFGIAPRDARDIRLGAIPRGSTGSDGSEGPAGGPTGTEPTVPATDDDGPRYDPWPVGTSLRSAASFVGRRVRVAGALRVIETPLLTLDDGSGRGLVRLLDFDPRFQPPLHLGEVVNVTGTVATRDVGGWEIVAHAAGVVRASGLALPSASPWPGATPSPAVVSPSNDPGLAGRSGAATVGGGGGADLTRLAFAAFVGLAVAGLTIVAGALAMRSSSRRPRGRPDEGGEGPGTQQPA